MHIMWIKYLFQLRIFHRHLYNWKVINILKPSLKDLNIRNETSAGSAPFIYVP